MCHLGIQILWQFHGLGVLLWMAVLHLLFSLFLSIYISIPALLCCILSLICIMFFFLLLGPLFYMLIFSYDALNNLTETGVIVFVNYFHCIHWIKLIKICGIFPHCILRTNILSTVWSECKSVMGISPVLYLGETRCRSWNCYELFWPRFIIWCDV